MAYTTPYEYQPRTQKFQHPDGYEIDSAQHAEKILHLLNEASNMLLDLQVCAKGYGADVSDEFRNAYMLINNAYSSIYKLDTEFGYNSNTLSKVWKYPKFKIMFKEARKD